VSAAVAQRTVVERRAALGITQRRLAEVAGVSRGGLALLEVGLSGSAAFRGTVERALDRLERLAVPPPVCANPECGAVYARRYNWQVYCRAACGERARKLGLGRRAVEVRAEEAAAQLRRFEETLRAAREGAAPARSGLPVAPAREDGWYWATAPAQPTRACDLCGTHYRGAPAWRRGSVAACAAHDAWDVARWCAVHPSAVAGRGGFGE
jgi:transcriptional regulator with XRE-family HTH domain